MIRDNLHSQDLIEMFWHFYNNPKIGESYNVEEVGILIAHYWRQLI